MPVTVSDKKYETNPHPTTKNEKQLLDSIFGGPTPCILDKREKCKEDADCRDKILREHQNMEANVAEAKKFGLLKFWYYVLASIRLVQWLIAARITDDAIKVNKIRKDFGCLVDNFQKRWENLRAAMSRRRNEIEAVVKNQENDFRKIRSLQKGLTSLQFERSTNANLLESLVHIEQSSKGSPRTYAFSVKMRMTNYLTIKTRLSQVCKLAVEKVDLITTGKSHQTYRIVLLGKCEGMIMEILEAALPCIQPCTKWVGTITSTVTPPRYRESKLFLMIVCDWNLSLKRICRELARTLMHPFHSGALKSAKILNWHTTDPLIIRDEVLQEHLTEIVLNRGKRLPKRLLRNMLFENPNVKFRFVWWFNPCDFKGHLPTVKRMVDTFGENILPPLPPTRQEKTMSSRLMSRPDAERHASNDQRGGRRLDNDVENRDISPDLIEFSD